MIILPVIIIFEFPSIEAPIKAKIFLISHPNTPAPANQIFKFF